MPEPHDFEQIARRLIVLIDGDEDFIPQDDLHRQAIVNQIAAVVTELRQVWNARGAADLQALEPILGANMDHEADAIRELDR